MVVDLKMLAMIFIINFAYITLNTIRFMLTMKGYRVIAPLVSMAEITIYVLGLSMVLNRLDNPLNLLVYALGYAVGISVGIKIEDYLALGYIMVLWCYTKCCLRTRRRTNGFRNSFPKKKRTYIVQINQSIRAESIYHFL